MKFWLKRLFLALVSISVIAVPSASLANTRAGGNGTYYGAASGTQASTFLYSSWLVQTESDGPYLLQWVLGGTAFFGPIQAVALNNRDSTPPRNQSNGTN